MSLERFEKPLFYHSGVNRNPDVVPTKVGNHLKYWIPVFTGNPGFAPSGAGQALPEFTPYLDTGQE